MRPNLVKRALKAGKPVVGTWLGLSNVTVARFLARTGFEYLTVDIEHNAMGMEMSTNMFAAIADAKCTALARVPCGSHDQIKRVLDNGAHGVVVPMVNTRQEAEIAVAACLYPPIGNRSVGGSTHALNFDTDPATYYAQANHEIAIILQCEHIQAVRDFDAIFSVPGIDAVFVGPNDLAASMRSPDGKPPAPETFKRTLADILAACQRNNVAPGIHTFSVEEAKMRIDEGWRFIAINSDLRLLMDSAKRILDGLGVARVGDMVKY